MNAHVHTKTSEQMVTAAFFLIAKNYHKWINYVNSVWSNILAIKKHKLLIQTTTWMNLKMIVLSERARQKEYS